MHPGPMNRGVEIDGDVADDPERSVILDQVELGVAVRMACLDLLTPASVAPDSHAPSEPGTDSRGTRSRTKKWRPALAAGRPQRDQ